MSTDTLPRPPAGHETVSGLNDPRLLAWRGLITQACVDVLRAYQQAWTNPALDDAARAAAAVGVVDPHPCIELLPLPTMGPFAALVEATSLSIADEAPLAAAWWAMADPQIAVLLGAVHDDASRRHASLGLLAQILAPLGIRVSLSVDELHRLVRAGLLEPVPNAATPVQLPTTTAAILAGERANPASPGIVAPRVAALAAQTAGLLAAGAQVLVRCEVPDDRALLRDAVAALLGVAAAPTVRTPAVAALLLRLGHELPVVLLDDTPGPPEGTVLALGGPESIAPPDWHTLDAPAPCLATAELIWREALHGAGLHPTTVELADVAGRLPLAERTVSELVTTASRAAHAVGRPPTIADVSAALRAHPRHDPGGLARRLPPAITLDDLVLPGRTRQALEDVIAHARYSPAAQARLGLTGLRGRAVIALFHGPSGTGKTAAAEAVAQSVDRDLWIVDLAKVVSKWLGETQRNLDAVLREASSAGAVLLFDEADGLFGKRAEVKDARDRYANLEIDHLLQRVELHTGVVILTSNRPAALDEAFARRIRLAVRFDLPDHPEREEIWRRYLPDELLENGTSIAAAAREELSGAAIRAAALAATVSAIAADTAVRPGHLDAAVHRELEKNHRPPTARSQR